MGVFRGGGFEYAFLIGFAAALLELIPQFGCGVLYIPGVWCASRWARLRTVGWYWDCMGDIRFCAASRSRRSWAPIWRVAPGFADRHWFVGMRLGGVPGLILGPIVMVVLAGAVRAHLFEGMARDAKTIALWMTDRWHRDEKERKNAAG